MSPKCRLRHFSEKASTDVAWGGLRASRRTVTAALKRASDIRRYGRRQSVHRVRLRKPKRLPFLLARVSRTDGQPAYVCSGCHRWSRCVGPAGARRACRHLDGLSDRGGVSIGDPLTDAVTLAGWSCADPRCLPGRLGARRVPLPWRARRRCAWSACGLGQPGGGGRCQPGLPPVG